MIHLLGIQEDSVPLLFFLLHLYTTSLPSRDPKWLTLYSRPPFYPLNHPMRWVTLRVWDWQVHLTVIPCICLCESTQNMFSEYQIGYMNWSLSGIARLFIDICPLFLPKPCWVNLHKHWFTFGCKLGALFPYLFKIFIYLPFSQAPQIQKYSCV